MGGNNRGTHWYNNGTENKMFREGEVPKGWQTGTLSRGRVRTYNNGTISRRFKEDEEIPEGWIEGALHSSTKGTHWYNNGSESKMIRDGEEVPEGFVPGQLMGMNRPKNHWYNNGSSEDQFAEGEEIPEGWRRGRLPRLEKRKCYNNGEVEIRVKDGDGVPEGFAPGGLTKGKGWYNNGTENRKFREGEVPNGWVPGLVRHTDAPKKHYYNNGVENRKFAEGSEVPKGFKPGKLPFPDDVRKRAGDKRRETCKRVYGVNNFMQSDAFKEKFRQTMLKRHGVEHALQSEESMEKMRQTNIKHRGVEYTWQSEEVQEKAKQTNHARYGDEQYFRTEDFRRKSEETCMRKYQETSYSKTQEFKDKFKKACQKEFGVNWACQRTEFQLAGSGNSAPNRAFAGELESHGIPYAREFPLGDFVYDFKVGDILVEVDPYPNHNSLWSPYGEGGKDTDYHLKKSRTAERRGYRVIHLWDWDDVNKVLEILKPVEHILLEDCRACEVPLQDAQDFLNEHHLNNSCIRSEVAFGLYLGTRLVSVMTFGESREKGWEWEALRYCGIMNVHGNPGEELLTRFIQSRHPDSVIAYCDRSKFDGKAYAKAGMQALGRTEPRAHWYNPKSQAHFTEGFLRSTGVNNALGTHYGSGTSLGDVMKAEGFVPIYDCGVASYGWRASKHANG